ncbi:MAG: calcium/sodium antiporter [Candidatus Levybacteria bacterium]|nr:calcium/sodium antiporter [Candidatus Levybacteria bacterium]MDZ4227646.1 calcium/sodium antiporter [Candidatus Levybacteria bacterium]
MLLSVAFFCLGILILIKGSSFLVDGASSVAAKLKISVFVVGLTVVAFGTSTPELVVSVTAVLEGSTGIALGNVVGSNIFNVLIVLGISAIVFPLKIHSNTVWREIPMSLLAAIILAIFGLQALFDTGDFSGINLAGATRLGEINFSNGLVLLFFFIIFIYYSFGIAKTVNREAKVKQFSLPKSILFIFLGFIGLVIGGNLTVENAVFLARQLGFSENFIGLTLVAAGTSLPELFVSVVAVTKRNSDIAVGNVIGSNIFNIFFVLGTTSLVRPIPLTGHNLTDILVLFAATIFLFFSLFVLKKFHLGRIEGAGMVVFYLFYLAFLVYRG